VTGRQRLITAAFTLAGAALFAYVVRRAGLAEIVDGVQRVGWGMLALLVIGGCRFALRAESWRLCMPAATPFPFGRAFQAFIAGDAVGNVTPLGLIASEPAKVFLARHHLATRDSVSSLAVENLIYAASVAALVAVGVVVTLATVPLPAIWQWVLAGGLGAVGVAIVVARRLLRGTWDERRGPRPRWREQIAAVRLAVVGFSAAQFPRLRRAFALDAAFHMLAITEVFLTLQWVLGDRSPTLVQAIAFEALNRVVIVAFKFVPFRIGIDEALTGAAAPMLAVDPAAGITLAVVRKVRNLIWTGIGLAVIAAHPARAGREMDRAGSGTGRPL
jgi:hypothetical protein